MGTVFDEGVDGPTDQGMYQLDGGDMEDKTVTGIYMTALIMRLQKMFSGKSNLDANGCLLCLLCQATKVR
jgi:hypothetical protein